MNTRDRYLKFMHYESVDHPPMILPGGPWGNTRERWAQEGLPMDTDMNAYFGIEGMPVKAVDIKPLLVPSFEPKVVEETENFLIQVDHHGVLTRNFKDNSSMPEHLEYPIKSPQDLAWLRERLAWDAPERVSGDWLQKAQRQHDEGALLFANGGMYFAFLNEHMGTDTLLFTYYDHPDFIKEVNELLCRLCENTLATALPHINLDRIGYHEDMAYKNGSMISPDLFREFMTPYYKRVTSITEQYGIDLHLMDSDGDIRELIPLWLECGINDFAPCEVAAGMDVVALRKQYGHDITMEGGFDKRILAGDKKGIKEEFERLTPVIEEGGFLLSCDHLVPPDVPLENYAYLVELMKSLYGLA